MIYYLSNFVIDLNSQFRWGKERRRRGGEVMIGICEMEKGENLLD